MLPSMLMAVAGLLARGEAAMPPARVGQIFIIGNEVTPDTLILDQLPLHPGQVMSFKDLKAAERNLYLNLQGVGLIVQVLDPDEKSQYKDILVKVQETPVLTFLLVGLPGALASRLRGR